MYEVLAQNDLFELLVVGILHIEKAFAYILNQLKYFFNLCEVRLLFGSLAVVIHDFLGYLILELVRIKCVSGINNVSVLVHA